MTEIAFIRWQQMHTVKVQSGRGLPILKSALTAKQHSICYDFIVTETRGPAPIWGAG